MHRPGILNRAKFSLGNSGSRTSKLRQCSIVFSTPPRLPGQQNAAYIGHPLQQVFGPPHPFPSDKVTHPHLLMRLCGHRWTSACFSLPIGRGHVTDKVWQLQRRHGCKWEERSEAQRRTRMLNLVRGEAACVCVSTCEFDECRWGLMNDRWKVEVPTTIKGECRKKRTWILKKIKT